jgi:hypothetical protein
MLDTLALLQTMLLMQFQKHEDKVEMHMRIFALVSLSIGFNRFPNIFLLLVDGCIF